jgi:hypothetical protein
MNNSTQQVPSIFNRAPDSQFDALDTLLTSAKEDMDTSRELAIASRDLSFVDANGNVGMHANDHRVLTDMPLTHYSLMQACRMAKLDTDVVRRLHMKGRLDLAVANLETLFPRNYGDHKTVLLNSRNQIRALNGGDYGRLWDYEMYSKANELLIPAGFVPAVAVRGFGSLLGANRTALFRGDQTSFGFFFMNNPEVITHLGGLRQGIMIWNSEVGARSFGYHTFYFRSESGTVLVGDIENEQRNKFVHRGDISKGVDAFMRVVRDASKDATTRRNEDLAAFNAASNTVFALTNDEAIEKLNKLFDMTKGQAEAVVQAARMPENGYIGGAPLSVWNISLGIAWEAAQTSRAESMIDDTKVATKVIRKYTKK